MLSPEYWGPEGHTGRHDLVGHQYSHVQLLPVRELIASAQLLLPQEDWSKRMDFGGWMDVFLFFLVAKRNTKNSLNQRKTVVTFDSPSFYQLLSYIFWYLPHF